jgi:hypothetical protein
LIELNYVLWFSSFSCFTQWQFKLHVNNIRNAFLTPYIQNK